MRERDRAIAQCHILLCRHHLRWRLRLPRSAAVRAQLGRWLLCFHDPSACFAVLDKTASTRRLGGTPFGGSHSPASAFLHCHHSFSCASNRGRWKEPINCDLAKSFFFSAFRNGSRHHPKIGRCRRLDMKSYPLVCWPTHIGAVGDIGNKIVWAHRLHIVPSRPSKWPHESQGSAPRGGFAKFHFQPPLFPCCIIRH
jgi:hypothetical protein